MRKLQFKSVVAWLAAMKRNGQAVMIWDMEFTSVATGETRVHRQLTFDDGGHFGKPEMALWWWGRDHKAEVINHLLRYPLAGVGKRSMRAKAKRGLAELIPNLRVGAEP